MNLHDHKETYSDLIAKTSEYLSIPGFFIMNVLTMCAQLHNHESTTFKPTAYPHEKDYIP